MALANLINESLNKNPIGFKNLLDEELKRRIADRLEENTSKKTITQSEFNTALTKETSLTGQQMAKIYEKLPNKKDFTFKEIQDAILQGYPFKPKAKLDLAYKVKKYWSM